MGKLHELLAVEASTRGVFQKVLIEAKKIFGQKNLFYGRIKHLQMFSEEDAHSSGVVERVERETTVSDKLEYLRESVVKHLDVIFQKDIANTTAKANLEIPGFGTAPDIPATYFLTLEKELKQLRDCFEQIPTLDKGIKWQKSNLEQNVWETSEPKETFRTKKFKNSEIVAPATKEHKAQVVVWDDDRNVGKYSETWNSGAITSAEKSDLLKRIDFLLDEIKKSRAKANCQETTNCKIGDAVYSYIIGN